MILPIDLVVELPVQMLQAFRLVVNFVIASNEVTIFGSAPAVSNTTVYPYTVTTLGGSCEAASLDGTITVNPEGIITLTSGSGTDTQVLCEGDPIDTITYELFDGATDATVTGLPAGVSFSVDVTTNIVTISGTPDWMLLHRQLSYELYQ